MEFLSGTDKLAARNAAYSFVAGSEPGFSA
jgi:hypothetical protein